MLFRRRKKAGWLDRLREFFWPRKGFTRPARYLAKRILRLSASPHAVAAGVAAGTFSAFTPLLGFHVILALALAYLMAGNLLAAALATTIANPLTIPLIALATFRVGEALLCMKSAEMVTAAELFHRLEHLELSELWQPVLKPMLAGAGLLGIAAAALAYGVTRLAVRSFKARRHARLLERAGLATTHPALSRGDKSL
ncbi:MULTISPECIES: DUF2062 domain-containing protein [unclassified Shinella]|uniref:DUF2062 domain-containing protein n=1 Tax=unclassified Shinella TaxID=2643062 RepID=UPI00225DB834|nr:MULTISPECIES: DUF2062 domain-containing protein [unclassified Shinella]MCO5136155.1 DUF2062 domain-containing protein [Shinella sp.]MDC7254208.1 DUF2062 domain-containing protein [Shinella sp. YE25]CAI0336885.1 conserved membrane hypothetical protein [Rhizobiaceae bacterium]CAK7255412.1 DUF2062 domain-containing protein [Shinella sp. WSC3-e]